MEKLIDKNRIINSFKDELKLTNAITEAKKKCRCGHTQLLINKKNRDYVLCTYCGTRLYYDNCKQKEYNLKIDKDNFIRVLEKHIRLAKNNSSEVLNYER